jgi:hypothetical protein
MTGSGGEQALGLYELVQSGGVERYRNMSRVVTKEK